MPVEKRFYCESEDDSYLIVHKLGITSWDSDGIMVSEINLSKEDIRHLIIELENKLEEMEANNG